MRKAMIMAFSLGALGSGCAPTFDRIFHDVGKEDSIVLHCPCGSLVLVSPRLQGRVMTSKVGSVESVGFVCLDEIKEGETHPAFNNFGGQDRFWLGPEAGQFGIYFEPGVELKRDVWKVPPDLNSGPFTVVEKTPAKVRFTREMSATNYIGNQFKLRMDREVGIIAPERLPEELGVPLPLNVHFAGSYSDNKITNTGAARWEKDKGLVNIWILGQFQPGPKTVIIAPFKPGEGAPYRDKPYFGEVPSDRLKTVGQAILLHADAAKESKIGIPQMRTTGTAGSFDFAKNVLVVVKFDVPSQPELYGNSEWVKAQPQPYAGDLFQAYNSEAKPGTPSERYAFYELESVSPSRELNAGESLGHRHATYCFQGDYEKLKPIARQALGVDLDEARKAMGW